MKKPHKKLLLERQTMRTLASAELSRVAAGEDTNGCPFDPDPSGAGGGGGATGGSQYTACGGCWQTNNASFCVCG